MRKKIPHGTLLKVVEEPCNH